MIDLNTTKPGDVLSYWHDSGAMGASLSFAIVLKVSAKRVRVRDEMGSEGWKYPEFFNQRLSAKVAAELRAGGVKI